MKVLFKKIRKTNIFKKLFYFSSVILYIGSLVFMTTEAMIFKSTEPVILAIVLGILILWGIIYLFCGLISLLSKKKTGFIVLTIITLLIGSALGGGAYYLHSKKNQFDNIVKNTITYTTNLIALKETQFNATKPIGMVDSPSDIEGNIIAKKLIEKEKITNKIYYYEDYNSMISDMYKGKIIGCFVSSNYEVIFEDENFEEDDDNSKEKPLSERVKVLYEYSEERDNQDIITLTDSKDKKLTEPFTVLVMGVDSAKNGLKANQAFNGDTLIMITFNPSTLSATMFSLPRDLYVPIACNHNRYAKINSSAAYGSSCVIKTIKQLTGINIDYYVKINFTGVVELIDAIGGVTVDVEEPDFKYNGKLNCKGMVCEQNSKRKFGKNVIYVPTGVQKLNGEQALAYARNRHQYAISDIARNQHQQQIIEAAAKQAKNINSITEFESILAAVSNNIETNMSLEQMVSFYSVGKDMLLNSSGNSLSIKKTSLAYYNLGVWLPRSKRHTSALGYYQGSMDAIIKAMKENLGKAKPKAVKTFDISYNEDYKTPIIGRGITSGGRLQLVKDFTNASQYEAQTWCNSVGITCYFETKTDYHKAGTILSQSAHKNELVKSLSKITFYISDGLGAPPVVVEPDTPDTGSNTETTEPTEPTDPTTPPTETPTTPDTNTQTTTE